MVTKDIVFYDMYDTSFVFFVFLPSCGCCCCCCFYFVYSSLRFVKNATSCDEGVPLYSTSVTVAMWYPRRGYPPSPCMLIFMTRDI